VRRIGGAACRGTAAVGSMAGNIMMEWRKAWVMAEVIAAAAGIIGLVLLFFLIRRYLLGLVDQHISQYQNELMERHMEEVQHMYQQTRGWRHDLKSHVQTMKAHLFLKEYDKLEEYLNELDVDLETVDSIVKTGNVMMDAILNSKLSLARSKNIQVEAKVMVPSKLQVSEVDLNIIIGNLMDNAMEACLKIEDTGQRFLRVYIDVLKGQLYIYVMNSMKDSPKRLGKRYETTKNSHNHGFGLMRMDKVVDKYHGYLDRQNEEGVFVTEVMLPL